MESGWHDIHRFSGFKEDNSHIGRIARSYLVDSDMILNKFQEFEQIYKRHSEALHILMPEIAEFAQGKRRYRSMIDIRQGIDHIIGDDTAHMFIESQNGDLSRLVSQAIGREPSWYETHIGFEKIMEQRAYAADPLLPAQMLLSIRKTRKRVGKLGRLLRDYFKEHGIFIKARSFACAIGFALGIAERRVRTMSYPYHFSAYDAKAKRAAGADMLISRMIMSSPFIAYHFGRNFDESDRSARIIAPQESRMYARFEEFLHDIKTIKDPYAKPSAEEFWKIRA